MQTPKTTTLITSGANQTAQSPKFLNQCAICLESETRGILGKGRTGTRNVRTSFHKYVRLKSLSKFAISRHPVHRHSKQRNQSQSYRFLVTSWIFWSFLASLVCLSSFSFYLVLGKEAQFPGFSRNERFAENLRDPLRIRRSWLNLHKERVGCSRCLSFVLRRSKTLRCFSDGSLVRIGDGARRNADSDLSLGVQLKQEMRAPVRCVDMCRTPSPSLVTQRFLWTQELPPSQGRGRASTVRGLRPGLSADPPWGSRESKMAQTTTFTDGGNNLFGSQGTQSPWIDPGSASADLESPTLKSIWCRKINWVSNTRLGTGLVAGWHLSSNTSSSSVNQYGGFAKTSGPFSTRPYCQIGDTDTIWSLVVGSQGKQELSVPPIWQLGHRACWLSSGAKLVSVVAATHVFPPTTARGQKRPTLQQFCSELRRLTFGRGAEWESQLATIWSIGVSADVLGRQSDDNWRTTSLVPFSGCGSGVRAARFSCSIGLIWCRPTTSHRTTSFHVWEYQHLVRIQCALRKKPFYQREVSMKS